MITEDRTNKVITASNSVEETVLQNEVKILVSALSNYLTFGAKSIQNFEIDCASLSENFFTQDIRDSEEFRRLFEKLKIIENSPCLYIFETQSETPSDLILEKLKAYGGITDKVIPKLKTNIDTNSKTLYVGKANNLVWGRLITHLGFHTHKNQGNPKPSINHGLQLFFWAKEIGLKIKYTVIEFESDMKDLLPVLEKKLADQLQPIIGTHK